VLKDLGYKKVLGIFDRGKDVEIKKCKDRFKGSGYDFFEIETNDIRDKEKYRNEEKGLFSKYTELGIFTDSYRLKDEYSKNFIELIEKINSYFNSKTSQTEEELLTKQRPQQVASG
jgi:hypothetical protein